MKCNKKLKQYKFEKKLDMSFVFKKVFNKANLSFGSG